MKSFMTSVRARSASALIRKSGANRRAFTSSAQHGGGEGRRRARVLVVGTGRMGKIRASCVYSNPRFELCGIVDPEISGAVQLAEQYGVRATSNPMVATDGEPSTILFS